MVTETDRCDYVLPALLVFAELSPDERRCVREIDHKDAHLFDLPLITREMLRCLIR